jgi:hypothetical protein
VVVKVIKAIVGTKRYPIIRVLADRPRKGKTVKKGAVKGPKVQGIGGTAKAIRARTVARRLKESLKDQSQ